MDRWYQVIDEISLSVLGTFDSRGAAVNFIAALLSANDDSFLDELTIANDTGPVLYGDALRDALRRRDAARERVAAGGGASGSGNSGYSDGANVPEGRQ